MSLAVFGLVLFTSLISKIYSTTVIYPTKNEMNAQDYIDRANYLSAVSASADKGGASFTSTNDTQAGPFKFHLIFPLPSANQNIHSLTLNAIMETNTQISSNSRRRLDIQNEWIDVDLTEASSATSSDFYYEISIPSLESLWIKTDLDTKWRFSSVFKFYFNSTENGGNLLNLLVQCPVTLTRPKTVDANTENLVLRVSNLNSPSTVVSPVDIDLSISASLLPCIDNEPTDLSTCTRITVSDPTPVYILNSYGKFELFLDNSDFAGVYYLIKNKIEMKTDIMPNAADFTSSASVGPISLGKMTFKLPMAIVGDTVTISAISSISTTVSSRRMMASGSSKATFATADVGVTTGKITKETTKSFNYLISVLFYLMALLII